MANKLIIFLQFFLGSLVSFVLSPLFPLTTEPLLSLIRFAPPSKHVLVLNLGLNLWLLIIVAVFSLVCPILVFFQMRKRWASFSWGLYVVFLLTGFPGYFLVLGDVLFSNKFRFRGH